MIRGRAAVVCATAILTVISAPWRKAGRAEALENGEGRMVYTLSGRGANVYLIKGEGGWVLVDTGMKGNAKGLQKALSNLGIDTRTIRLIIITHAHPDQYGELASLKRLTGAKVLAHRYEAPFIENGRSSPIVAQTAKGRLINAISPKWKMEGTPPGSIRRSFTCPMGRRPI